MLGPNNESRKRPQIVDKSVGTHSGCPPFLRRFVATFGFCFRVRVHEGSVCSKLFKYVTQTSRAAVSGSHRGQPSRACFSGMLLGQPSRAGISGKHLGEPSRAAISGSHLGEPSRAAISDSHVRRPSRDAMLERGALSSLKSYVKATDRPTSDGILLNGTTER